MVQNQKRSKTHYMDWQRVEGLGTARKEVIIEVGARSFSGLSFGHTSEVASYFCSTHKKGKGSLLKKHTLTLLIQEIYLFIQS